MTDTQRCPYAGCGIPIQRLPNQADVPNATGMKAHWVTCHPGEKLPPPPRGAPPWR